MAFENHSISYYNFRYCLLFFINLIFKWTDFNERKLIYKYTYVEKSIFTMILKKLNSVSDVFLLAELHTSLRVASYYSRSGPCGVSGGEIAGGRVSR